MKQWPIMKGAFKQFVVIIASLLGVLFVVASLLLIYCYFGALIEKIRNPSFKNLDAGGFVLLGFLVLGLGVANYFIVQKLISRMRG